MYMYICIYVYIYMYMYISLSLSLSLSHMSVCYTKPVRLVMIRAKNRAWKHEK